jgi:LacI family transcriptional regulator
LTPIEQYGSLGNRLRNRLTESHGKRRSATLADVAAFAGVSASTASRALNGRGELSEATRAAVIEAARQLGFQPSPLARSLRTRTTFTVGFVVPDVASPFYAAALKGAQRELEAVGYRVMLMDAELSVEGEVDALRTLLNHQVDGLLLATAGIAPTTFDEIVASTGTPCVFFDSILPGASVGAVALENDLGTRLLVEHLLDHGHERIAFLAGSQAETSGSERLVAFHAAARERGVEIPPELVRICSWEHESGRHETDALLKLRHPPTGLVSSSVELALGAMAACREHGVGLPDDLALVTFDDAYFGAFLEPPLTAIAYEPTEVGRQAAVLLVEAMQSREPEEREVRIPVTLVTRRSCGCGAA